jgi:hypothetical protein
MLSIVLGSPLQTLSPFSVLAQAAEGTGAAILNQV